MEPKAVQAIPHSAAVTCQWMNEMNAQNRVESKQHRYLYLKYQGNNE